ncbi:unnamed protein product [Meganyctiphanes norvegica]|uniref:RHD domain-containing protein n=1 Tax=Meganyctiphanes norvegica TaxID=48144 RepID=A0AAV2QZ19_MEGNR
MTDPMFVAQRHNASNQMSLNISDVIDIIGQDEDYDPSNQSVYGGMHMSGAPSTAPSEGNFDPEVDAKRKAYVKVIEQPQPKALRFRYICEGRSAGSIPGIRSNAENKTYPAIQVCGYKGPAVVVVSCVTVDPPYRPHPHNLVGKEGCKKGVCTMQINSDTMTCVFSNLGIQCVKKRDVEDALKLREEIRVDPFQTGFTHRNNPQSIDLNSVRLCFQVFLQGANKKHFTFPIKACVSEPIYDKKATSDLIICKLSDCTSSVAGGKEIILLCDKVTKEDIQVRFYEVKDGMIYWEAFGDFQASDVHKQVAISFKTPRYKILEIENPVKTYIELVRPSDNMKSEARPFTYLPLDSDPQYIKRKIAKYGNAANTDKIGRFIAENMAGQGYPVMSNLQGEVHPGSELPIGSPGAVPRPIRVASRTSRLSDKSIKAEPLDHVGSPGSHHGDPSQSPQYQQAFSPPHPGHPQMSPGPPASHGMIVKPPVSPNVHSGGIMYTVAPPPSHSPVTVGGYYPPHSTAPTSEMSSRVSSNPSSMAPQYYPTTGGSMPSPQYHQHAHSPLGPPHGGYVPSGGPVAGMAAPDIPLLLNMDSQQMQPTIELDIGQINSAELRSLIPSESDMSQMSLVDQHLSANMQSNLNIIDNPPPPSAASATNKFDSKSNITAHQPCSYNIPPQQNVLQQHASAKYEPAPLYTGSDSFNNLKSEIEALGNMASHQ